MIVALKIVEQPKSQGTAEPLRPHGGVIVIRAGAIQQNAQAAQGLPLCSAIPTVTIVARRVNQDAHAADRRTLGNILCIVYIIAGHIHQHRDAEHRAALNARLCAFVAIITRHVHQDQHGALRRDRPFVIDILAAQVDHRTHTGHLVEFIDVIGSPTNDDLARRSVDRLQDGPADALHLDVALVGQFGQFGQQLRITQRHQSIGCIKQRTAIHLFQHIAKIPTRGTIPQGMTDGHLSRENRI